MLLPLNPSKWSAVSMFFESHRGIWAVGSGGRPGGKSGTSFHMHPDGPRNTFRARTVQRRRSSVAHTSVVFWIFPRPEPIFQKTPDQRQHQERRRRNLSIAKGKTADAAAGMQKCTRKGGTNGRNIMPSGSWNGEPLWSRPINACGDASQGPAVCPGWIPLAPGAGFATERPASWLDSRCRGAPSIPSWSDLRSVLRGCSALLAQSPREGSMDDAWKAPVPDAPYALAASFQPESA